jgi:cytochrome c
MSAMGFVSKSVCVAFALAGLNVAAAADESVESGRQIFDRQCRTCHGGTAPADSPIGPNLAGIVGKRAGSQASGIHSQAAIDSRVVWDRESLRRFLSVPRREIRGSIMPVGVTDPAELERLLDYLESLR